MLLSKIRFILNSNNNTNEAGARLWQNKLSLNNSENNGFDNYKDCIIWTNYCHEGVLIVAPPNQMKNLTTFKNGTQLIFN